MKVNKINSEKWVETISVSASILDLVNSLNSHHISALVMSSDGKTIDGIVSERDIVRAMPGPKEQDLILNSHMHAVLNDL
jgi:CBS domain-containing protein